MCRPISLRREAAILGIVVDLFVTYGMIRADLHAWIGKLLECFARCL